MTWHQDKTKKIDSKNKTKKQNLTVKTRFQSKKHKLQHNLTSEKNNNFKMTWLQKHFKDYIYIYIYIYIVFCVIYKQELTPKAKLKQRLKETILLKKQD